MKTAVIYARVSSKDQEREGYSIPAQLKALREYARTQGFRVAKEFVDVETAKVAGRKQFGEMVRHFQEHPDSRTVLVEKTDRLYRNFRDAITLDDLGVELHLVKENRIIGKDSKSQDRLVHDVNLVLAKNYIENLREEVKKGMREKAEQGIFPSRAPFGYRNNRLERTIEVHPEHAEIVKELFELYASGQYSLDKLRKQIIPRYGLKFAKTALDQLLKNPFYYGQFTWEGKRYAGTHQPLISLELFERVQANFKGHNHSKHRKHDFAFAGLLHCAHDNCMVTAEIKKNRYIYYHCTEYRGKCGLPYFREEALGNRLGEILKNIHIPNKTLAQLQEAFRADQEKSANWRNSERAKLQKRLVEIRNRIDLGYQDKLDGKITEDFWTRKSKDWQQEEYQVSTALRGLEEVQEDRLLNTNRILELANKAHSLYVRQNPAEQAKLLRIVLSNCGIDGANLYPTYRKPFELILQAAKTEEWWAWADSNCRPPV
jgi:site-specific DNA recombinase